MHDLTTKELLERVSFLAPLESQKEYRLQMATFIRLHRARVKAIEGGVEPNALPTISILVLSETGCGKTYVASQLAKASGVNFITIDCSTLSRAGWKGVTLANAILSERDKCSSKHKFDRSIVLFDEFDKVRVHPYRSDEGNPQPNFLRMFDGELQAELTNGNMENIDTSKMSFIFAGAFANGLADLVKQRITPKRTIGFSEAPTRQLDGDVLKYATFRDIQNYGIMGELCGRIGSLVYLPPLTNTDYRTLIKGDRGSALIRYKNLLGTMGVDADITDEVCDYIAEMASKSGLGARSINSVLFLNFQKAIEAIEDNPNINKVILELQDENMPGLSFEFGERKAVEEDPTIELGYNVKLPDINFSVYISSEQQTLKLLGYLMDAYAITRNGKGDLEERLTLRAFLCCALCYLKDNVNPDEMTLMSLEMLAGTTEKDPLNTSTFDVLIGRAIKASEETTKGSEEEEEREICEIEKRYNDFVPYCKVGSHMFFIDAVRDIRRNWYRRLYDLVAD